MNEQEIISAITQNPLTHAVRIIMEGHAAKEDSATAILADLPDRPTAERLDKLERDVQSCHGVVGEMTGHLSRVHRRLDDIEGATNKRWAEMTQALVGVRALARSNAKRIRHLEDFADGLRAGLGGGLRERLRAWRRRLVV